MGDQITLQEYDTHDSHEVMEDCSIISEANVMTTQSGEIIEIQPDQTMSVPASGLITSEMSYQNLKPQIISVQAGGAKVIPRSARGKNVVVSKPAAAAPPPLRQVAIAPKPSKIVQGSVQKLSLGPGKQYAIAPKPMQVQKVGGVGQVKAVTLVANKQPGKGNAVLTFGKPVVVMPGGAGNAVASRYKLPPNVRVITSHPDQAQLIQNVTTSQAQGNKLMKVVVQGSQADLNQPAVITKLVSVSSAGGGAPRLVSVNKPQTLNIGNNKLVSVSSAGGGAPRLVSVNKPQTLNIGNNKVVIASPSKTGGIKYTAVNKTQFMALKQPVSAAQATQAQGATTKKVVLSGTPGGAKNVIKLAAAPKTGAKTIVTAAGQKTQLHQINVPGKGIQYIRLNKTFVLSDGKGNVIHMTAEKMSQQPPPLVRTTNKVSKPPQKLVRLAPLSSKLGQAVMVSPSMSRGGQSLLAPLTPMPGDAQPSRASDELDAPEEMIHHPPALLHHQPELHNTPAEIHQQQNVQEEAHDSKAALRALIADTVGLDYDSSQDTPNPTRHNNTQLPVEFDRSGQELDDSSSSLDQRGGGGGGGGEHPLIVIPQNFIKQEPVSNKNHYDGSQRVELDVGGPFDYQSLLQEREQQPSPDPDMLSGSLGGMRPRKACNCTKSQCLKLYCDCFANGEFCNRCNCNNCHNNLENEELRQKAIRGCLDRNPNAFRPKIGKAKISGADHFRRHNKGCNCKRSGCLKNYCECYEAKIACTNICKCVGCRNVEESVDRARRRDAPRAGLLTPQPNRLSARPIPLPPAKQPCSFMTSEVIEAVCHASHHPPEVSDLSLQGEGNDPARDVIEEFTSSAPATTRPSASHHPPEVSDLSLQGEGNDPVRDVIEEFTSSAPATTRPRCRHDTSSRGC
ncbi:tesmin/TSO1-like CXC domain, cysteine-rich domain-containing protein [Phthorimaea operculella]|nr:tesmin/TSO1-like CXC domain, cysteine-rich domain-containing protein [Phthorimaea operculella]